MTHNVYPTVARSVVVAWAVCAPLVGLVLVRECARLLPGARARRVRSALGWLQIPFLVWFAALVFLRFAVLHG